MPSSTDLALKTALLNLCTEALHKRIAIAENAMNDAQQSANAEERSTAGDKYDTSRAMSHNIRDMNARQLQEALNDLILVQKINPQIVFDEVRMGSVVKTTMGNYFLAVSGGPYQVSGETYYGISPQSPIGQLMLHKKKGDSFMFRGKAVLIQAVL